MLRVIFCLVTVSLSFGTFAQVKYTVSGYVSDLLTGEKLISANVFIPSLKKGTVTSQHGHYSFSLTSDSLHMVFSMVGYERKTIKILLDRDIRLDVSLQFNSVLQEVTVTAPEDYDIVESTQMGVNKISAQTIERSTVLLGEADVLKTIQLLPGVKTGNEGFAGVYIRGGTPDQNLILLDGVPVYNVNHLFGFLSTMNTDAVRDVTLIKGGIPARYGGRISSVIDISLKEGNTKNSHGSISVSPLAGRVLLEGPVVKGKSSYLISGRRSWIDLPMRLLSPSEVLAYAFSDFNFKYNHAINPNNKILISIYASRDKFLSKYAATGSNEKAEYSFRWGNATFSARWNKAFKRNLFSSLLLYQGKYNFSQGFKSKQSNGISEHRYVKSNVIDRSIQVDNDWSSSIGDIKFGAKVSFLSFLPEVIDYVGTNLPEAPPPTFSQNSFQAEVYIEDDIHINTNLLVNLGFRNSILESEGKINNIPQPRISGAYLFNKKTSVKISYTHAAQFLHLLTNPSLKFPTDLWVPSTKRVSPERSSQWAASFNKKLKNNFELSIEGYYKTMKNLVEYKDGANYLFGISRNWEDKITIGKGESYGLEFLLNKKKGFLTGWVAYTLSYANRIFPDINEGKKFPFKYDRRHDVSVFSSFNISKSRSFSAIFTLATGNHVTMPVAKYSGVLPLNYQFTERYQSGGFSNDFVNQQLVINRNNYQLPIFHRLDINYQTSKKTKRDNIRTWTFSVFNLYNRKNIFYLYQTADGRLKKLTLFPVMPSVSYKLDF